MRKVYLSFIALGLLSNTVSAQFLKGLKDKATQTVKEGVQGGTSTKTSTTSVKDVTTDKVYDAFIKERYQTLYERKDVGYKTVFHPLYLNRLEKQIENPRLFRDSAQVFNYPALKKKLEEKGAKNIQNTYEYSQLVKYGDSFRKNFDENLGGICEKMVDEGLKAKQSRNYFVAISKLQNALYTLEGAVLVCPDLESKVKKTRDEINTHLPALQKEYATRVFQNDFHKKNVRKIMFSKEPINVGQEREGQFATSFKGSDNIYAMAYFEGTIKDITDGGKGSFYVTCDNNKDGSSYTNIDFAHNESDYDNSTNVIDFIPAVDKAFHANEATEFANFLKRLSPRQHTLQIWYNSGYNNELAYGEINLDLSDMNPDKLTANAEAACKKAQDNWAKNVKLPVEFSRTTKKFKDPALTEAKLKELYKSSNANCAQILKFVVFGDGTADDWYIHKNDVGIPTHMETNPAIGIVYKGKDGWCYFVKSCSFKKEYQGGGTYGAVKYFTGSTPTKLDCANVK